MNRRVIFTVLAKELRETLRDRRTLIIMIVVPVLLYPAMLVLMEQVTLFGRRSLEAVAVRVAVVGGPEDGRAFLEADPTISTIRTDSVPLRRLRDGSVDAVLVFAAESWAASGTNRAELLYDGTRDRSGYARGVLDRRLAEWRDTLLADRLQAQGLPEAFALPLAVEESSIATPQEVGGYMLGRFLPLLLIMMTILGAFYPSIDLAAGEKERGTLEPLLTAPVHADNLVIGKFAAAALMGLTAATLNLASMLLTFQAGVVQFGGFDEALFELPPHAVLVIFGMLTLLAILFASLFLGIAVRSHSFKEAQNALTPVYILSFLPAMLPMMPGIDFDFRFAILPVAGVAFMFRELMSGGVMVGTAVVAVAATVLYTALALVFAARAFGREEVLFGSGGMTRTGSGSTRWQRPGAAGRVPTPAAAVALVAACGLLFFYGARPLLIGRGEVGVLLSQWLFLAAPALLFVVLGRYDGRATLSLQRPSSRAMGAAFLIIAGGIPLGWLIAWLQSFVLQMPVEVLEALQQFVMIDDPRRIAWILLIAALTPAICEELVFRGVLLGGVATRLSMPTAIMASALIFGAFHLSFETAIRFLPTTWLGVLLGYVVWHTRSIFTVMLMHFVNNAFVIALISIPALRGRFADPTGAPPWLFVAAAPIILWLGVRLLPKRSSGSAEPSDGSGGLAFRVGAESAG